MLYRIFSTLQSTNLFNNKNLITLPKLMSFFGRIKNIFVESIVDDEFYQPISQHEIYAVINRKKQLNGIQNIKKLAQTSIINGQNAFDVALTVSENTPEIQIRLLGYQPSVQNISKKVNLLKAKLDIIESHLLANYQTYLLTLNRSLEFYTDGKQFYSTRKKGAELRFIIEKMNKVLCKSKAITKLNIYIKNLKNTLKLLQKIPNIKKMNLMQLKSIDLNKLQKTNEQISLVYHNKLLCLTNLSKYISKVNNQSFVYIINNIKMCLENFDEQVYEEIMRSYLIIQPQTILQKLLISLIEEKIRQIFDNSYNLQTLGTHLIQLMINMHKIIKWHMINRAIRSNKQKKSSQNENSSTQNESIQPRRRLSITSNNSEDEPTTLQLNQIVYINLNGIKEMFNKTVDCCITDIINDNIIASQLQDKEVYHQLQIISKISEICLNFTGLRLEKLKKTLMDYFNRKQNSLFLKYSRELVNSIQQQRNDWNRLAFPNNFKFVPVDKLLYRWSKILEMEEYQKISISINKLFSLDSSLFDELYSEEEQTLELKIIKIENIEKLQKKFEEWLPKDYLQLYEGDVIICQSSYKMLSIFQKYTQFLIYTPITKNIHNYYEHMLVFLQYQIYFIFQSLLSSKYRTLFFEPILPDMQIERIYTLKRFKSLYPKITTFVNSFKAQIDSQANSQSNRIFSIFKKEIRQINTSEQNQALRAKVIATQSCKYCLAYFHQILKTNSINLDPTALKQLHGKIQDLQLTINELSTLLLNQSSQNMVGVQLQTIRSLFQSIRWYESYQDLKQYVQKIISIIRESFQRLKSCNRGEIPSAIINFIFIFIWRTIITFSVKLFLQNKNNNKRQNKLNFEKFIDTLYFSFQNKQNKAFSGLSTAYNVFKSIFKILLNNDWEQCKQLLLQTMKKYDYIYSILINILQNTEYMSCLTQKQKQMKRLQFKQEIELSFKQKK